MRVQVISWVIAITVAGCGSSQQQQQPSPPPSTPPPGEQLAPERAKVTKEQCEAQGGSIVGDIGDGATGRPDYVCPSGKPPLGNIAPPAEGPVAIEGAVCCPS